MGLGAFESVPRSKLRGGALGFEGARTPPEQGWRNYSRGGGLGLGGGGPRGKGSQISQRAQNYLYLQLLQLLKNSPREAKRDHFRYTLGPPRSHPGNGINPRPTGVFL